MSKIRHEVGNSLRFHVDFKKWLDFLEKYTEYFRFGKHAIVNRLSSDF